MSAQGVMARAMKAGLGIDEASRKLGRLAALNGKPAWACPKEVDRLSWFAGYADGAAENRLRGAQLVEWARSGPQTRWTQ